MTDQKLKNLTEYLNKLKIRLADPVPPKHLSHPETFKVFLRKEIASTEKAIEAGKLSK